MTQAQTDFMLKAMRDAKVMGEAFGLQEAARVAVEWAEACTRAPEARGALTMLAGTLNAMAGERGKVAAERAKVPT